MTLHEEGDFMRGRMKWRGMRERKKSENICVNVHVENEEVNGNEKEV